MVIVAGDPLLAVRELRECGIAVRTNEWDNPDADFSVHQITAHKGALLILMIAGKNVNGQIPKFVQRSSSSIDLKRIGKVTIQQQAHVIRAVFLQQRVSVLRSVVIELQSRWRLHRREPDHRVILADDMHLHRALFYARQPRLFSKCLALLQRLPSKLLGIEKYDAHHFQRAQAKCRAFPDKRAVSLQHHQPWHTRAFFPITTRCQDCTGFGLIASRLHEHPAERICTKGRITEIQCRQRLREPVTVLVVER